MDALLSAFVAAGLAEWGDRTQLLVALLAARTGRPGAVLAGLASAALASSLIAALAGQYLSGVIAIEALGLLLAIALLFAGIGGLISRKTPEPDLARRAGPFLAAFLSCLVLELGDRSQFLTFAIAARFDSFALAGCGAAAGILAAGIPAALIGAGFRESLPLRPIRWTVAALFLVTGFFVGVSALRLV